MLYGHKFSAPKNNPNNQGTKDYEASFFIQHKPTPKEDANLSLRYLLTPSKREAGILLNSKDCVLKYKHVKKIGDRVET